eukprot:TRINITY_DN9933_c0_g2_i2.p1 TRINITY_DN9933_c0_g2~~TRINITY_DN9933_c0_g2_i2.p1  ORF type:complete len:571 (+),score=183.86 TRINITY_DN9933_c0_g2_i2:154-1713(+)
MPLLTTAGVVLKGLLTPAHAKLGAAAPLPPPAAAAAAPAAAPPAGAVAAAPVAAKAAAAVAPAAAVAAPAAVGAAAGASGPAASGSANATVGTAAASHGATSTSTLVYSIFGGVAVVGSVAAGVALFSSGGIDEEGRKPLKELVAKQGDLQSQVIRKIFTVEHEAHKAARQLLAADGECDSGGNWTWSSHQEDELRELLVQAVGTSALRELEPQVLAAWQPYGGSSDELSERMSCHFIDDYFDAFVDTLVPNLLLSWVFLKEGPACPADVLAMDFDEMLSTYPLYALTLENFMDAEKMQKIREDWKNQDKPPDLVKLVTDCMQANPQQFIPQSDMQIDYSVHRRSAKEKVGMNAVGSDQGVFLVEIVPGSAASVAAPSGGGPPGLKAGMRVIEVADMPIRSTADIGTAVHTSDGCPRINFKVRVSESCARVHRINKVQGALRAEKVVITQLWRRTLCNEDGKLSKRRLLASFNIHGGDAESAAAECKAFIAATHGPVVRFAKEYIPKLGDTPVRDCAIQ